MSVYVCMGVYVVGEYMGGWGIRGYRSVYGCVMGVDVRCVCVCVWWVGIGVYMGMSV